MRRTIRGKRINGVTGWEHRIAPFETEMLPQIKNISSAPARGSTCRWTSSSSKKTALN